MYVCMYLRIYTLKMSMMLSQLLLAFACQIVDMRCSMWRACVRACMAYAVEYTYSSYRSV